MAGDGLLIPKIAAGDLTARVTPATVLALPTDQACQGGSWEERACGKALWKWVQAVPHLPLLFLWADKRPVLL